MDITILVKQVYWYISRVSGERLQDHWSSGFIFPLVSIWELMTPSSISCGFREEDFSHYKPMADIAMAWSIWTPGAWLAGFMKGTTECSCIQNIEALGL